MKLELWMSWVGGILSAILIFVLAFLVLAWICKNHKMFDLHVEQNLGGWCIGLLIFSVFIGTSIGSTIHKLYDRINPIIVEETVIYEPVSISDVIASEGEESLTYICIDSEQFYTFYYKYGNGYRTSKISSDNAIIYQTDDIKPQIVKKTTKKACGELVSIDYKIYIPKGSIIEKFNLDSN